VRNAPLVSIDLIITDDEGAVLIGRRNNEPAKGFWFVPGGRIRKGESRADAFARLMKAEVGLDASIESAEFAGVWEHHYRTNTFEDPTFGTHYVVLAYRLRLEKRPGVKFDDQHGEMKWVQARLLATAGDVHENTAAYFR
jgi:colanic acid biosynthesis protein WcaH